jgi:hypothetical protein
MKKLMKIETDLTPHEEDCPVKPHTSYWYKCWKELCPVCDAPASVSVTFVEEEEIKTPFIRQKSFTDSQI